MRRVLYDATSPAAAAAADLLRDEFDVAPLSVPAASPAAAPAVVLVGPDSADRYWGDAPLRVVVLVAPDADRPEYYVIASTLDPEHAQRLVEEYSQLVRSVVSEAAPQAEAVVET